VKNAFLLLLLLVGKYFADGSILPQSALVRVSLHWNNADQSSLKIFIVTQHVSVALEQVSRAVEAQRPTQGVLYWDPMRGQGDSGSSGAFAARCLNRTP